MSHFADGPSLAFAAARSTQEMVPPNAVIVWQLCGFVEEVDCYFVRRSHDFTLTVERAGERLAEERYGSLHETMARAREMKRDLIEVGFKPVAVTDVEPALDSLLRHFVREGTALLHAVPGA
jgi:hypothetical protein